jgi:hypothetical protein
MTCDISDALEKAFTTRIQEIYGHLDLGHDGLGSRYADRRLYEVAGGGA